MGMPRGFRYLEYMSDAFVEAEGSTLEEAFANAALGLLNVMLDINKVEPKKEEKAEAEGMDLESLLYNWLEFILLKAWVETFIPHKFDIRIDRERNRLEGRMWGEPYDRKKHGYKSEVKGVTYHEMKITQKGSKWKLRFLLDL